MDSIKSLILKGGQVKYILSSAIAIPHCNIYIAIVLRLKDFRMR